MKPFLTLALLVTSLAVAAGPSTIRAGESDEQTPSIDCEGYASLSREQLIAVLNDAVAAGATGWPGRDTVCFDAAHSEAQLPGAMPELKRHPAPAD